MKMMYFWLMETHLALHPLRYKKNRNHLLQKSLVKVLLLLVTDKLVCLKISCRHEDLYRYIVLNKILRCFFILYKYCTNQFS